MAGLYSQWRPDSTVGLLPGTKKPLDGAETAVMNRATRTSLWMGAAFIASLTATLFALAAAGTGPGGVVFALRLTARVSFLFFWPAYVGGAVAELLGPPFDVLSRRAREFGLAFAAAQTVHLGLVVWIALISANQTLVQAVMPFFAIGIVWTYLLAFSSLERVRGALSPELLRALRTIGVEYIALVFFVDFIVAPSHPLRQPLQYVPFWILLLAGPCLRLAATVRGATTGAARGFG